MVRKGSCFCGHYSEETCYLDPGLGEAEATRRGLSYLHVLNVMQIIKPTNTVSSED